MSDAATSSPQTLTRRDARLRRFVPILGWLPTYPRAWFRRDAIAGMTVLALLVPEGMAYAQIAGVPPETAFYAAPIGLAAYAVFGSSRQLVVAVSATVAVLSAATVGELAPANSPEFIVLTAALAMLAGAISIIAGILRVGRLAQFFSESVLVGFIFGLALVIAVKQVPKILGIDGGGEDFFERCLVIVRQLPQLDLPTTVVGLSSIALMILIERRFDRVPAALAVLIVGIAVSVAFDLAGRGVEVVGPIPSGLAPPTIPAVDLEDLLLLLPGAIGIALISFAEAVGPARDFASRHGYEIDADQELIALGAANMGAGLFQGFSIGSSLSKSAANDAAGARSSVSLLTTAILLVAVALFLTWLFEPLPEATLGAIVIVAVSGMMKVGELRRLAHLEPNDLVLAVVALGGVLIFGVELGLAIAVAVSLLALVWHASRGRMSVLGEAPAGGEYASIINHPDHRPPERILVLRPDEPLFFANAESFRTSVLRQIVGSAPTPRAVVIDLEMSSALDVPSLDAIADVQEQLAQDRIPLFIARVHELAREGLGRRGVLAAIGPEGIQVRVADAVRAAEHAIG